MRIVTGATGRSNIQLLNQETSWPTMAKRRELHVLCMFYKILNEAAPLYLCDILNDIQGIQPRYNLRNPHNIRIPLTRTDSFHRSFFPFAIRKWNSLPLNIKDKESLTTFKQSQIKSKNKHSNIVYYGERWASVHHARMRLGCSKLNNHLFNNLHVAHSSSCSCGHLNEDPSHFFLECPNYTALRDDLLNVINQLAQCNIETILFGNDKLSYQDNIKIFTAVQAFIKDSNRFV